MRAGFAMARQPEPSLHHDTAFKHASGYLSVRRQRLWDQNGDLQYGGFLAHNNPKEIDDEPVYA